MDANSPKELLVANLAFQRAAGAADPAARQAALKQTMKELTNKPEKFREKNVTGYNMVLAQTLSLWIADPTTPVVTTRGAIGATDMPEASIDLVKTVDESLKAIVAASPACAADVRTMRQSEGWLAMTRKALDLASGDPDSATFYAQHSLTLLPENNPYPFQVLGIAAQKKGDLVGAVNQWEKAVEASGTDSSYADIRQSSLFYVGLYTLAQARELSGDEQKARLTKAVAAMKTFMTDYPTVSDAPTIMQGLGEAYLTMGDTASVPSVYAPLLATPASYSDYALTMAGVLATQADKTDDAITLFEAAIAKNANQRDALRNLAASYYAAKQYDKMAKPLDALVAIDPNNYDAWSLYAFAAQGRMQAATAAPEKKKWTDSLIAYAAKADSLPVKVTVDEFERKAESVSFSVSLEGVADKPKANTFSVEFLDASGNVVSSASQEVEPITKGERKQVRLEAQGAGIVAYRYKPLT
jgi:tetratricopeptide (TPR) repeat protein